MSRKILANLQHNRISNLFSDLDLVAQHVWSNDHPDLQGWTWECDPEGFYLTVSEEVYKITGLPPAVFIGKSILEFRLPLASQEEINIAFVENKFPLELRLNFIHQDGEEIPILLHVFQSPGIYEGNGKESGFHGFTRLIQPIPEVQPTYSANREDANPDTVLPNIEITEPEHQTNPTYSKGYLPESGNGTPSHEEDLHELDSGMLITTLVPSMLRDEEATFEEYSSNHPGQVTTPHTFTNSDSKLLIELLDDDPERVLEEHERLLVAQVSDQLKLALENAHLISQTQQALNETKDRARELTILNEMSRALAYNLEIESIIRNIYTYTTKLMDTSNFYLSLYHPEEEALTFHHVIADSELVDENHPEWDYWSNIQPLSGLTGYVIKSKQPLLIEEKGIQYLEDENLPFVEVGTGGVESWLGVPMKIGDQVLGVVAAQSETTPNLYNQQDLELLATIANQGAIAIQNARLFEEANNRNEDLATINKIIRAASKTLDLNSMLEAVLEEVLEFTGYQTGLVSVYYRSLKKLSLAAWVNLPNELQDRITEHGLEGTLCQLVFNRGRFIAYENIMDQAPIDVKSLIEFGFTSYVGIPLESKGRVLGSICLFSREVHPVHEYDIRLLTSIGTQVGVAVDNARLFEQTQSALAETEILYNASSRINSAETYQDILSALTVYSILGQADINITINLFDQPWKNDKKPDSIHVMAQKLVADSTNMRRSYPLESMPSLLDILRPDRPVFIGDIALDPRLDDNLRNILIDEFHSNSVLFAPLIVSGQWIGFLNGMYKTKYEYHERDLRRLSVLANLAAVAIQNIHLLEVSLRRANQLETAAEIARDTSSTLSIDMLLERAVNMIREGFKYSHASIFLLDESGRNAIIHASTGDAGKEMLRNEHQLRVGAKSIIGHVTSSGTPYVVNNVFEDPYHFPNPLLPDTKSEAAIPLMIGNKVIGALDLQSTKLEAFTPEDISVLHTLADQIAVAVENTRAYELTVQAVDDMRNADKIKSQFLANMSHELRTPLNSIIGFSRVILKGIDGPVTELQQQDLNAIYNSGQHLLNLINDILDLSKIEAGKMEITLEENVNLSDLINSVMSTVVGLIKDKPIALKHNLSTDIPPLRVDPTKVRQILINLFSNAAKFTDEGSITIDAGLQKTETGLQEVLISVTDTGTGIAEHDQNKLFQPFSQVDASATRKTGGSGLGLSISRHLVEMHGGRIGLSSEPGKGSIFFFTLPVPSTKPKKTPHPVSGYLGPIVMSIDDESQVTDLYNRYLDNHGFKIFPLADATNAVEIASKLQPMAITLDVMMDGSSGWQVLKELKSNPDTRNIPVIICSIVDEQGKGYRLGATDYLVKPILEDDLINSLNRLQSNEVIQEILVIDDNLEDRRLFEEIFNEKANYLVDIAESGDIALTKLRSHKPHIVVLDLFMPGLDGFTVLETMRDDPNLQDLPVIVYTAGDLQEDQRERLAEFSQALLKKGSVTVEELLTCLEKSLQKYHQSQARM